MSLTAGRAKVVLQGRHVIKIPESVEKARQLVHQSLRVQLHLIVVVAVVYNMKSPQALGDGCIALVTAIQTWIVQMD